MNDYSYLTQPRLILAIGKTKAFTEEELRSLFITTSPNIDRHLLTAMNAELIHIAEQETPTAPHRYALTAKGKEALDRYTAYDAVYGDDRIIVDLLKQVKRLSLENNGLMDELADLTAKYDYADNDDTGD